MYLTQGLKRAAQLNGDGTATVFNGVQRSWEEVATRVATFAEALKKMGVNKNSRVAVLAANSDYYLECFYAIPWSGGVIVPINTRWRINEVIDCVNDCQASILLVDSLFCDMVSDIQTEATAIEKIVYIDRGAAPSGMIHYDDLLTDVSSAEDSLRGGGDLAGLFYTGGTTGKSKGVMLSHNNIFSAMMAYIANSQATDKCVHLHCSPMFHLADIISIFGVTIVGGGHVFLTSFEPKGVLQAIQDCKVTRVTLVPTMILALLGHPDVDSFDLSSLTTILYGGAPISEALLARAMKALPHCDFIQVYGMTELSPLATLLTANDHRQSQHISSKLRSVGRPASILELKIVDEEGAELPRGKVGEIVVRGPNVMQGYWGMPETTEEVLIDGWMHTGDAAYMDKDGYVYIADRIKDLIVTGGENVYSVEVENIIAGHPMVSQCAVIGVPSAKWGEAVHAIVVPHEGRCLSVEEIIEYCNQTIAGYKCPKTVEFRTNPLPLSGVGKVLKSELRLPYWENT